MSDTAGSVMGCAALTACLLLTSSRASAQPSPADPPASPEFMARYDVQLALKALNSDDERFSWDGHVTSAIDVFDYVRGRSTIFVDYEVVLGSEFRAFDPNQSLYTLAASSSVRAGRLEFAGVFHHVSRHLSDRPKRIAIAWNDLEGQALGRFSLLHTTVDLRAVAGKVVAQSYVDYSWTGNAEILVSYPFRRHAAVYGKAFGDAYGINAALSQRGTQTGGRVEGGLRLSGSGAALELFGGYERVVDADPFEQQARQWVFGGFRIVNR
jgi:hypothetical protein